MKPLNKLLFAAVMMLAALTVSAATTFEVGNYKYEIYDETNRLITCTGLSTEGLAQTTQYIKIPGAVTYNGTRYRVYKIGPNAFANNTSTGVTAKIEWGVHTIEENAFKNCTRIRSVELPSSVQYVGSGAFVGCTDLHYVEYSSLNTKIISNLPAWDNNGQGLTLFLPKYSKLTASDFTNLSCWANFTISNSSQVGDVVYYDAYWCVPSLGVDEQQDPTVDVELYLVSGNPNSSSFAPTMSYILPVTYGFRFVFKQILPHAFEGYTNYTKIDLDKCTEMTSIFDWAFQNCTNLTTLKIPKSVYNFNTGAIVGCTALEAVEINSENQTYASYDGAIYDKSLTTLYRVPEGKTGSVSYPNTLKTLKGKCHRDCKKISTIRLPYGVNSIEYAAFAGTTNLKNLYIPSSVTSLDDGRYVFSNTNPNLNIWCNMNEPPTVTASNYFGDNSNMKLYIPYGKQSVYSDAGWTGFAAVNANSQQAHDFNSSNANSSHLCFTVTSTASTTINGTTYDGRVKLVCAGYTAEDGHTSYNIPPSVTDRGKSYAVTRIGEDAFNNITNNFVITGCANVDTIGAYAFYNQPVTNYSFTHNLKNIGDYAFAGAGLTGTVAIPYGVKSIGMTAFAYGNYSRFIMPASVNSLYGSIWYNTTTLQELVINLKLYNYTGWNLGTVPSNCYIRVPVGVVDHYKQNSALSARADYITAGAYDYAVNNNYTGRYFLSILSANPVTYNGTTYAGTAKYVYHPNIKNSSSSYGFGTYEEDRTVSGDIRHYLITEIGDSCFAGATFTSSNALPPALTRIGHYAFYQSSYAMNNLQLPSGLTYIGLGAFTRSKLTGEIKIPSSVTTIGNFAFYDMAQLTSLYFYGAKPTNLEACAWDYASQNPNLTVWVPNQYAYQYYDAAQSWLPTIFAKPLGVYIKPTVSSMSFSSVVPTNMSGSDINAYIATAYDKSNPTQQLTMTRVQQSPENVGMILTDLTVGHEYRIQQPANTVSPPETNYLVGTPRSTVRIDQETVGYYWNRTEPSPHFTKPSGVATAMAGQAYLLLDETQASGMKDVYTNLWPSPAIRGDINGDSKVDVTDVNIIINIMLGKATAASYPGNPDVNNDNKVDVTDVNAVINIMLGKE